MTDNLIMANHAKAWGAKLLAYLLPRQNMVAELPGVYVLLYSFDKELYLFLEDYTMLKFLMTATMLAVLSFAPMSLAQTADSYTPPEEGDCDNLNGALYGLCVAYCEAMDCDSPLPNADESACDHVFGNYMDKAIALEADDVPPCPNYEQPIPNNEENDSDDTDDFG